MLEVPVAKFFFSSDHESRGDPFVVMRSWLSQMISHPRAFALVRERWTAQQGPKATREDIIGLLREIVITIPGCTLVLDGLDELGWLRDNQTGREDDSISSFLQALRRATANTATRILIVSRNEPEIRTCLSNNANDTTFFEHKITPEDVRSDVVSYSRDVVHKKLPKKSDMAKEDITQKLADRCNGQFLWIKLQENSLRSGKNQRQLEQAISSTPTGLEHIYERNWIRMSQLPEEDRDRAFSLLRWATFALRPLTVREMTEALLIDEFGNEIRVDDLPDTVDPDYIETEISYYCGSLLEVRSPQAECYAGLRTVHLAHFSVKEYLLYNAKSQGEALQVNKALGSFDEVNANTLLAKMCLRYVNCHTVWLGSALVEDARALGSFRDYAAGSWRQHATIGELHDAGLMELVNLLFDTRCPSWASWKKWFDLNDREGKGEESVCEDDWTSPMYYAAWLELKDTVSFLMHDRSHGIDERGALGRTALMAACIKGNIRIAKMLLERKADVTIGDNMGLRPIYGASLEGHLDVVKLLLENGADITATTRNGTTLVNAASSRGHLEVVKLLLENGAEIKTADDDGWTPVNSALADGHLEVVKLLLENDADITVANNDGWTPVNIASFNGYLNIIKLLLENDANITTADNDGWTPVYSASTHGHYEVVKLLLENGADTAVSENSGWTPVSVASTNGHLDVVKILLNHGADITIANNDGWTPLNLSSAKGHLKVVKLLLENNADITIANKSGMTPINASAANGHSEVVKLLLENAADITTTDDNGWTPVLSASANGHYDVVKLLLESGANITDADNHGWTPVNRASLNGHIEVVKLLLENDANITTADTYGWTPVYSASTSGHYEVVKLLLENGANITTADSRGRTPVHAGSDNGHVEVVKLHLQSPDLSLDIRDLQGRTPLFNAAVRGQLEVVQTLYLHEASVDAKDFYDSTPLFAAVRNGHDAVVDFLIACAGPGFHLQDGLGRTLIWWAKKSGCTKIVESIRLYAQQAGVEISQNDLDMECSTVNFGQLSTRSCDVCTRRLLCGSSYNKCRVCFDFDICLECFDLGGRCQNVSHEWSLQTCPALSKD
jgi:ankyrin repeat protein